MLQSPKMETRYHIPSRNRKTSTTRRLYPMHLRKRINLNLLTLFEQLRLLKTIRISYSCTSPVTFGQEERSPLSDKLCELVTLKPAQSGLGVPNLKAEASLKYAASKLLTKHHVALESINCESVELGPREQFIDDLKRIQPTIMMETAKSRIGSIDASLCSEVLCLVMQSRIGSGSWLNSIQRKDQCLSGMSLISI